MADHPDDAGYAGIRSELARLFIAHKVELGMADIPDELIVANVNRIAEVVMKLTNEALDSGDSDWLQRNEWWVKAGARLYLGLPAMPLDG